MNLLMNLIVAVQIISALVMIGLVLIQHGKGADMGASFGSGASGSLFGATGSANFLSRSTAVCAAVFFACTLTLAFFANDRGVRSGGGGSVPPSHRIFMLFMPRMKLVRRRSTSAVLAASSPATSERS